jgi:hypothetical protein
MVKAHDNWQAVVFIRVDHTVTFWSCRVEEGLRPREHLMVDDGTYKVSGPCSTEQGVEVNVADPP